MSNLSIVVILAAVCSQSGALALKTHSHLPKGWKLVVPGSRPGSANPPHMPEGTKWLYNTHSAKREAWGDRLVAAVQATATEKECGGFVSFGDFTWCAKAMPKETEAAQHHSAPYGPMLVVTASHRAALESQPSGAQFLGITLGIRERDLWSELMSNRYQVPTDLYDCFFNENRGPMYDSNLTALAMGKKACPTWKAGVCYGADYNAKRVCVGTKDPKAGSFMKEKTFVSMRKVLQDRAPLSTHMKMDIEGSEWDVLAELLKSDEEIDKIRTLDMECHFMGFKTDNNTKFEKNMEAAVRTMELLSKKFAVVGSTVQATHEALEQRVRMKWPVSPLEPMVYNTNGFSLDTFTVDLVNKKLL